MLSPGALPWAGWCPASTGLWPGPPISEEELHTQVWGPCNRWDFLHWSPVTFLIQQTWFRLHEFKSLSLLCIPMAKTCVTHLRWYLGQFYVNKVINIQAASEANLPVNKKGGTTINNRKKGHQGAWKLAQLLAGWTAWMATVRCMVGGCVMRHMCLEICI